MAQGILTKSSEKVPLRSAAHTAATAASLTALNNARLSVDSAGSTASPLQASYAEFLQQRRQSLENNKNRRRASSSSPARRRSTSRGSSPATGPKLKPSYMSQTHSSKKKSGSPTPELRVLQGLHRAEAVVPTSVHSASSLLRDRDAGNYSRGSLLPADRHHSHNNSHYSHYGHHNSHHGHHNSHLHNNHHSTHHHINHRHTHQLSSASNTPGNGLHDEASSVAASESMHVQDMSMGNATLAYRADSAQRGRSRVAPSSGQSKATRSSSSGVRGARPAMDKAQLRLLFEDLGDGHGHGKHAWSGSLRSHSSARLPSGKKPLRINL